MKKISIIALTIFLTGCTSTSTSDIDEIDQTNNTQGDSQQLSEEQQQLSQEQEEDTETLKNINNSEASLSKCEQFNDSQAKQTCQDDYYLKQAEKEKDPTLCENIVEPQIQDLCVQEAEFAASI